MERITECEYFTMPMHNLFKNITVFNNRLYTILNTGLFEIVNTNGLSLARDFFQTVNGLKTSTLLLPHEASVARCLDFNCVPFDIANSPSLISEL